MFIAESNDFAIEDIKDLMINTDDKFLPNLICILDKGIIVKARIIDNEGEKSIGNVELFPEFIDQEDQDKFEWVFLEMGEDSSRAASNFAFFIFSLNSHLNSCLVMRPNILKYFSQMFRHKGQIIK